MTTQPQPPERESGDEAGSAAISDLDIDGTEAVTGGASLTGVRDSHDRYANLDG